MWIRGLCPKHQHGDLFFLGNFSLRDLMFDRIRRRIRKDRSELVKHEESIDVLKYYQKQHKLIINEWNESRRSLLTKAEAIFSEAFELIEKQRVKNEEKEKQLRICNELYEKVSNTFLNMITNKFNGDEAKVRESLLKYCERDTLGMVIIWEELKKCII